MKHNPNLLNKLNAFSLDNPEAAFSFSDRLCRENGWSKSYAVRVIEEYKKFVYLSVITGKSLTPSDEVDQAWHLHLIYSRSYWVEMCEEILGGFKLHHGPTKGGQQESEKYNNQYQYTLDVYKEVFGVDAPSDIWPDLETRFSPMAFKRIDVSKNIVLKKNKVKEYLMSYALPILGFLIMFITMSNTTVSDNKDEETNIWWWVIGLALVIFIIRGIYRYANRHERKSSSSSGSSSSSSDSGCGVVGSFFGCGSSGCSSGDSGCGSSGCGSSCGSSCGGGCGGCGS